MSLPLDLEKAIGEEKANRPVIGTDHDLAELIEKHKTKAPPKEEKKGEADEVQDKEDTKSNADKATELLAKKLGFTRKSKKEADEKKDDKPEKADASEDSKDDTETPSAEVDKGTDTETADVGADKEKPKKAKISKKPDIDPIEIASAAAARTAQAFVESHESSRAKAAEKTDVRPTEDLLSEEEKGELEVFREMAKADPRFKELPRQYVAYLKKAEDYQRQWEKDHPTEEFNPEAGDHDAFYAKHQPKYSELEYKKAIVRMESKGATTKELEELRAEQKRLKAEAAVRDLDPVINQASIGALAEVIKGIDENILAAIQKDGFDKYAQANEVEADLIRDVATRIGPFITGLLQFDDPDGRIPFNEKNPAHVEAVSYLRAKEDELRKKPMRDRMTEDGKVLVPRAEYFRMNDSQKSHHAYLDTQMLLQLRIAEEAEKAQAQYQKDLKKAEARAKALGWLPPSRTENGHKAEEKKAEKTPPAKAEIKSPEAASASRVDTSSDAKGGGKKDLVDLTAAILFPR